MHSQRRLSPAPASPLPRSALVPQHSNRMQFLTIQTNQQQPLQPVQYVHYPQTNYVHKTEEHKSERQTRQVSAEKENIIVKAFPAVRIQSQHDQQQQIQYQQSIQQNQQQQQCNLQNYIDTALRNQKDEMHKLFEIQNQQIKEEQDIVQQITTEVQDITKVVTQVESDVKQLQQLMNSYQNQDKSDYKDFQQQIDQLKSLFGQFLQQQKEDLSRAKVSRIQEVYECSYPEPQQVSLDTYDHYIKKYESFNKQVSEYLLNRKLPDHLSSILNCSNTSDGQDSLDQIDTKLKKKDNNRFSQTQSDIDESPIKALDDTEQGTISPLKVDKELIDKMKFQYAGKMSTIPENEVEDEEIVYQIDQNGFILNQDGHHLLDKSGRLMKLSEKDIEYFKSKNQLEEIK